MSLAPIVYKSTDTDAPQINSEDWVGGFVNVLKKCLVEGYGDKQPAGWSLELEGNDSNGKPVWVLRNSPSEGSGLYFRFRKDGTTLFTSGGINITGLDFTPDHITGQPCRNNAYSELLATDGWQEHDTQGSSFYNHRSYSSTVPWLVIANARTVWAFLMVINDPQKWVLCAFPFCFGDYKPYGVVNYPGIIATCRNDDWGSNFQDKFYSANIVGAEDSLFSPDGLFWKYQTLFEIPTSPGYRSEIWDSMIRSTRYYTVWGNIEDVGLVLEKLKLQSTEAFDYNQNSRHSIVGEAYGAYVSLNSLPSLYVSLFGDTVSQSISLDRLIYEFSVGGKDYILVMTIDKAAVISLAEEDWQ